MTGFNSPNYTQAPNDLFDTLMKDMSEAELKIVMVAIRKTFGYHKNQDAISFTQFQEMTGLSRQSVADGIEAAVKRGVLKIDGHGKRGVNIYSLVVILDQSENKTSTSQENGLDSTPTSLKSRHTKETGIKEKVEKKTRARKNTPKNADTSPEVTALINAWAEAMGYAGVDIGASFDTAANIKQAKIMLEWSQPATPEEIRRAVILKRQTGKDYAFAFLVNDIPILRAQKRLTAPRQVQPDNTPFIPILYQAKIERGEMTREEVLRIMGSAS